MLAILSRSSVSELVRQTLESVAGVIGRGFERKQQEIAPRRDKEAPESVNSASEDFLYHRLHIRAWGRLTRI
jgi:hypothetical protein